MYVFLYYVTGLGKVYIGNTVAANVFCLSRLAQFCLFYLIISYNNIYRRSAVCETMNPRDISEPERLRRYLLCFRT